MVFDLNKLSLLDFTPNLFITMIILLQVLFTDINAYEVSYFKIFTLMYSVFYFLNELINGERNIYIERTTYGGSI